MPSPVAPNLVSNISPLAGPGQKRCWSTSPGSNANISSAGPTSMIRTSFKDQSHLDAIVGEAQQIVNNALNSSDARA